MIFRQNQELRNNSQTTRTIRYNSFVVQSLGNFGLPTARFNGKRFSYYKKKLNTFGSLNDTKNYLQTFLIRQE